MTWTPSPATNMWQRTYLKHGVVQIASRKTKLLQTSPRHLQRNRTIESTLRVSCRGGTGRQTMQSGSIATVEYCNQQASQDQIVVKLRVMILRSLTTDGRKAITSTQIRSESAASDETCLRYQKPLGRYIQKWPASNTHKQAISKMRFMPSCNTVETDSAETAST